MPLIKPVIAALVVTCAQVLAQTNKHSPARRVDLAVPLTAAASREAAAAGHRVATLKGVLELPAQFDARRPWPILLVFAPSGSSAVASVAGYTNTALAQGWVVAAVDGPKVAVEQDNNVFAWEMISSLLYHMRSFWPQSKQWPFACAGFSGGAKRAAMVAAEMMQRRDVVVGVFMGGCNEDRATLGFNIARPGPAYLSVPMFLSAGKRDPIAGPSQAANVRQSMVGTGFRNVRLETYDGAHRLDTNQLRIALEWFRPKGK